VFKTLICKINLVCLFGVRMCSPLPRLCSPLPRVPDEDPISMSKVEGLG
jgi:hypothetical protein